MEEEENPGLSMDIRETVEILKSSFGFEGGEAESLALRRNFTSDEINLWLNYLAEKEGSVDNPGAYVAAVMREERLPRGKQPRAAEAPPQASKGPPRPYVLDEPVNPADIRELLETDWPDRILADLRERGRPTAFLERALQHWRNPPEGADTHRKIFLWGLGKAMEARTTP